MRVGRRGWVGRLAGRCPPGVAVFEDGAKGGAHSCSSKSWLAALRSMSTYLGAYAIPKYRNSLIPPTS